MKTRVSVVSHRGLVRRANEDHAGVRSGEASHGRPEEASHLSVASTGPMLVVVADGLGGHPHGDLASRIATEYLVESGPGDADELVVAVHEANHAVYDAMDDQSVTMGTTIAAVLIHSEGLTIVNVGDSPVFEWRKGVLVELSVTDRPSGGSGDWGSGLVTQTIGGAFDHEEVTPHLHEYEPEGPVRLLLCTDGLTDFADGLGIASALHEPHPSAAAALLVESALAGGGGDNITVAVLDYEPLDTAGVRGVTPQGNRGRLVDRGRE